MIALPLIDVLHRIRVAAPKAHPVDRLLPRSSLQQMKSLLEKQTNKKAVGAA